MVNSLPEPSMESAVSLLSQSVPAHVDPAKLYFSLSRGYLMTHAADPYHGDALVTTRLFEMAMLALGMIVLSNGRWQPVSYHHHDEDFLKAANRLAEWSDDLDLQALRKKVPTEGGAMCILEQDNADKA